MITMSEPDGVGRAEFLAYMQSETAAVRFAAAVRLSRLNNQAAYERHLGRGPNMTLPKIREFRNAIAEWEKARR